MKSIRFFLAAALALLGCSCATDMGRTQHSEIQRLQRLVKTQGEIIESYSRENKRLREDADKALFASLARNSGGSSSTSSGSREGNSTDRFLDSLESMRTERRIRDLERTQEAAREKASRDWVMGRGEPPF